MTGPKGSKSESGHDGSLWYTNVSPKNPSHVSTVKSKGVIVIFPKSKQRVSLVFQNLSAILQVTQRSIR